MKRTNAPMIAILGTSLCGGPVALAQSAAPLPEKLVGHYRWVSPKGHKDAVIEVELNQLKAEAGNVTGILTKYRSPAGNCVADDTPFKGTYKDGALSVRTGHLKSRFADGRPCGGIRVDVNLSGNRGNGTLTAGGEAWPLDVEAK